jgi:hypothetical protein
MLARAMSFPDWLRNLIDGPTRIEDPDFEDSPGEAEAALEEESAIPRVDSDDEPEPESPAWDFPSGGRHA